MLVVNVYPDARDRISGRLGRALRPGYGLGRIMDELNGRLLATQLLITGLIARVANASPDPISFLTDFRDEMRAVAAGVRIGGLDDPEGTRRAACVSIDELFSLMKAPSDA